MACCWSLRRDWASARLPFASPSSPRSCVMTAWPAHASQLSEPELGVAAGRTLVVLLLELLQQVHLGASGLVDEGLERVAAQQFGRRR